MSNMQSQFESAVKASTNLAKKPDNATLLKIYSLYKQATTGDVAGKRPGFTDFVGRAKYDAWAKLKGTDSEAAKGSYVTLIEGLKGKTGRGFG